MIPITVTVLMNLLVGENPARLARRAALELLQALASALRHGDAEPLHYHQEKALKLAELRQRAGMLDHSLRPLAAVDGALIEALAELSALQTLLPADTPADACLPLAEACELCAAAYAGGGFVPPLPYPTEALLGSLSAEARPVVIAIPTGSCSTQPVLGLTGPPAHTTAASSPCQAISRLSSNSLALIGLG